MKTMQKGFTLIELMIVIAIIGILAAIAIPQYQNYIARSEVQTSMADIRGYIVAIEDFTARYGAIPSIYTNDTLINYNGFDVSTAVSTNAAKWTISFPGSDAVTVTFPAAGAAASPIRGGDYTWSPAAGTTDGENVAWTLTNDGSIITGQFAPKL